MAHALSCGLLLLPSQRKLHLVQTMYNLAGDHHIMSLGDLLRCLPSEVRVHIFRHALWLPTPGASMRNWLALALVSQCLLESL